MNFTGPRRWGVLLAATLSWGCSGGGTTTETDIPPDITPETVLADGELLSLPDGMLPDGLLADSGIDTAGDGFELVDDVPVLPDQVSPDLGDGTGPDAAGWCLEEGGFGCPCTTADDCTSGWCVQTAEGHACTKTCTEECPDGWHCTQVQEAPDVVYACMPIHAKLCRPCGQNQECQGIVIGMKNLCIDMGGAGNFCGGDCSDSGLPCPNGYACKTVTGVDKSQAKQCVPVGGEECTCSPSAIEEKLSTDCYEENEFGKCTGNRECTQDGLTECSAKVPGPEICNSTDDDCDGVADDNLIEEQCNVENTWGACPGTVLCVGGKPICQGKEPAAEQCDGLDNNCDGQTDETYSDCDKDGIADCIESDDDADGWPDETDNCPCFQNPTQKDSDQDKMGDACDPDDDNDGIEDELDCQPLNGKVFPGAQEECNAKDDDCDTLVDEGFLDTDADGQADCMDEDDDGDSIPDTIDNCPGLANPDQADADGDKQGDACDSDDDADGYPDDIDCGPTDKKVYPGAPELCDCKDNNCDGKQDEGFLDTDKDGVADCCEDDTDGDTIPNGMDNCPYVKNTDQKNTDGDLQGDACDPDDDNDGVIDELDCNPTEVKAFPNAPEVCDGVDNDCDGKVDNNFPDLDQDGIANCVDPDDDGDSIPDTKDKCPFVADPLQTDTDGDGYGDACDGDDDGDGDFDLTDCEPLNPEVNHNAKEYCNGKDDNCDKSVDEPGAAGCILLFPDGDGDGFGASGSESCLCSIEPPYTSFQGGDCDDVNPMVNPLAKDVCNGKDDDCDGKVDPENAAGCLEFFLDEDGDGYGVKTMKKCFCKATAPYSATEIGDCDPKNAEVFPGHAEVCDGADNDCDGVIDNVTPESCIKYHKDLDKDGFGSDIDFICACQPDPAKGFILTQGGDCNDQIAAINPGANEVCGDGVDNDCNGLEDENCVPSQTSLQFVSAGISGSGGNYKMFGSVGIAPAGKKLANPTGFTMEFGLIPTAMSGQP